jgi:general secretion pathway protein E
MHAHCLLAATSVFLVSFYKPLLLFVTFLPWAWLVSSKLEKDARALKLNYRQWNLIYMGTVGAVFAAWLAIPIFWVGWPLGAIMLIVPIYFYVHARNRVVPKAKRYTMAGGLTGKLSSGKSARNSKAAVQFVDAKGNEHFGPAKDDPRLPAHLALEDIIVPALESRASQADFSVGQRGAALTMTIDGVRYKRDTPEADTAVPMVDYLKEIAGLNVEDRRRRQSTSMKLSGPTGKSEMTIVTAGSSNGMELRLIFDRANRVLKPIDGLGLLPSQLEAVRAFEEPHDRHGIFLFAAPAGHGLTTTGYALLGRHDAYTSNVKTLEMEIKGELDGVDHLQYDPSNPDVDYPTSLQSILRRDPDIVLISELKEAQIAAIACDPGMQGPMIYVPQRLATINEQIRQWAKLVGDVKTAVKSLRVVMNQRLVRQVCPNCRQAYQPTAEQLRKMNLPPDKVEQLFQASGKIQVKNKIENCPVCGGTGYFAQIGIFQVMIVTDAIRRLLMAGDLKGALAEARRDKMLFQQEAALRRVVEGATTIDEVARVTAPPRTAKPAPKPKPNPAPTS